LALLASPAFADNLSVAIYQPGGGYLVTDARWRVAIELVLRDDKGLVPLERVSVLPGAGKAHEVTIVGPGRVLFYYQPPEKLRTGSDIGEIRFGRPDGSSGVVTLTLRVDPPSAPKMTLDVNPIRFNAADPPKRVNVAATAHGATELAIIASHGSLEDDAAQRRGDELELVTSYKPPKDLPTDAPSHVVFIAIASGRTGFATRGAGVSVLSSLRVSVAIEPGNQLVLEGSENKPAPVMAAPDGKTVIEDVVRYGAPVRAFAVRGGKKKELSISLPSGMVPIATVASIPGQAVADGGTGPTLIVMVPPGPFGDEPLWPEIEVQGAQLMAQVPVPGNIYARALILKRPRRPETITILGDGAPVGSISFGGALGESLDVVADTAQSGERAAVKVKVTDAFGSPADKPAPRARIDGGEELTVTRMGFGEYRVAVPSSMAGDSGGKRVVTVLLNPPKPLGDGPVEMISVQTPVRLGAAAAAVPVPKEPEPIAAPPPVAGGPRWRLGVLASGIAGSTFNGELVLGAGALGEIRLPIWEERLSLRTGFEIFRASGAGSLRFPDARTDTTVLYVGLIIPLLAGVTFDVADGVELSGRAGFELRNETGVLDAGSDRVGGGSRLGFGIRMSAEGAFEVGPGWLCASINLGGLGASASGFSSDELTFEGALTHVRLDVGYRFWF